MTLRLASGAAMALVLALASGCDSTSPASGAVRVSVLTTGTDVDSNGYLVGGTKLPDRAIDVNGSVVIPGLAAGHYLVVLTGVAHNCGVGGGAEVGVSVTADDTVSVEFAIDCLAAVGSVRISTKTVGNDLDPDGYSASIDSGPAIALGQNDQVVLTDVREGLHTISISDLANNCALEGSSTRSVQVVFANSVDLALVIGCTALPGAIHVSASTTGDSVDASGYTVVVAGGSGLVRIAAVESSGSATFEGLPVGVYTVNVKDLAANCRVTAANPQFVDVLSKKTAEVTVGVNCPRYGNIRIRAVTSGTHQDPDGYQVTATGENEGHVANVAATGEVTVLGLFPGNYVLTLAGATMNCAADSTSRNVQVSSGQTAEARFDIACGAAPELAFMRDRNVYVVRPDGTSEGLIATGFGQPSWSPGGDKLAVRSYGGGNEEIHILDVFGAPPVRLTNNPARDNSPAWSPDGSKIAFVSERDSGDAEIYVMNANGSSLTRLTASKNHDGSPAWSPDGSRIAFRSYRTGNSDIYVMNADGTGLLRLTSDEKAEADPAWSPDGSMIAFTRSANEFLDGNIFVMKADGTSVVRLQSADFEAQPTWSPDGQRIAYRKLTCGGPGVCTPGLYAMKVDGSERTLVVRGDVDRPAWRR